MSLFLNTVVIFVCHVLGSHYYVTDPVGDPPNSVGIRVLKSFNFLYLKDPLFTLGANVTPRVTFAPPIKSGSGEKKK